MALGDNIVSYWKMDEQAGATGTITDAVGNADGTNNNMDSTTGKINYGYNSSAATERIDIADISALAPTGSYTANIWYKGTTINHRIFNNFIRTTSTNYYYGWSIYVDSSGYLKSEHGYSNTSHQGTASSTQVNDGDWHMLTLTYDGTSTRIYVDGSLEQTDTLSAPTYISTKKPAFNGWYYETGGAWEGQTGATLDEAAFWSRTLSGTEVTELYNSGDGYQYPFTTTESFTKTGNARILIEDNQFTKNSNARIQINDTEQVYDAQARIVVEQSFTKTGNAAIEIQDNQFTKDANARVLIQSQINKTSNARILIEDNQFTKTGQAYIRTSKFFEKTGNTRIHINDIEFNKTSNARILIQNQIDKPGDSRILIQGSFNKTGNASIMFQEQIEKTGNARILFEDTEFTKTGNARISIEDNQFTKTGNALITFRGTFDKTGNATITISDTFKPVVKIAEYHKPSIKSIETFN